jgi:hypothetical protein
MLLRRKFALVSALLFLFALASRSQAQTDTPKFEAGVQFSALPINEDPSDDSLCLACGTFVYTGVGGRFTYNLNDNLALDSEVNFFLRDNRGLISRRAGGRPVQGLFGVKAGKRFRKVGVFAKARPGFLSFSKTISSGLGEFDLRLARKTHFNVDVGGVLEFYASRKMAVRLDAGDTIIRYGGENVAGASIPISTATTKHNFEFGAGMMFRF